MTGPGEFNFFLYFPAEILEFGLNPRNKLDSDRSTWKGCTNIPKSTVFLIIFDYKLIRLLIIIF